MGLDSENICIVKALKYYVELLSIIVYVVNNAPVIRTSDMGFVIKKLRTNFLWESSEINIDSGIFTTIVVDVR